LLRALLKFDDAAASPGLNPGLSSGLIPARKSRRQLPISFLYRDGDPPVRIRVEMMLGQIQTHCEDVVGTYVPHTHLERFYADVCREKKWTPKHWCVVGRQLGQMTDRARKRYGSARFTAYKIPRA